MKLKVIITGITGMVGEGVLHECLQHPDVEKVLAVSRRPYGKTHPKLEECLVKDFFHLEDVQDTLAGYNACFFCLGISSVGMKEAAYRHITYDLTIHFAEILAARNPDMVFCYVSGANTDSTEKGRSMWARVKGKTENDLMKLPFREAVMFRPGYIHPTRGLQNTYRAYKIIDLLYPLWKLLFPRFVTSQKAIGLAMIDVAMHGSERNILESTDINKSACH